MTDEILDALTESLKKSQKEDRKEFAKSIAIAILVALVFRSFAFEPFYIPSGSMKSTLLLGDYVFVSKYSYGYSRYSLPLGIPLIKDRIFEKTPKRGDVVVFKLPVDNSTNYIKRLIGLPGDTIQVKGGILYLNGEAMPRRRIKNFLDRDSEGNIVEIPQYIETLPGGVSYRILDQTPDGGLDNTGEYTVPEKHYFFMGDNRDNSQDSRVLDRVGFVPEINLLGPANIIFFSASDSVIKFWKWLSIFRSERFIRSIPYEDGDE